MQAILDRLVGLLPAALQPYAKAVVPIVIAAAATVVQWSQSGSFDTHEIWTAAGGAVTAVLVAGTRNLGPTVSPPDGDGSVPPAKPKPRRAAPKSK